MTQLDIGYNDLGDAAVSLIIDALPGTQTQALNPTALKLHISHTTLTNTTIDKLIGHIESGLLSVEYVQADNNERVTTEKLEQLCKLFDLPPQKETSNIKSASPTAVRIPSRQPGPVLNYTGWGLTTKQLPLIEAALEQDRSIRQLKLARNQLGDGPGIRGLMAAIAKQGRIHKLDLSGNPLTQEGAQALAEALQKNNSLTVLNLSDCQIDAEAAKILSAAIGGHPSLKIVNLNDNTIGDEGVIHLAKALVGHPRLATLHLKNNNIKDAGAFALLSLLQKNGVLQDTERQVPLHQLEISENAGINCALSTALPRATRLFGYLPYEELSLRKHINLNGEHIMALKRKLGFLTAIDDFLQHPPLTQEAYLACLEEEKQARLEDAKGYIDERSKTMDPSLRAQAILKIQQDIEAKITGLHQLYSHPDWIAKCLQTPESVRAELAGEIGALEKTREQYAEQTMSYQSDIEKIQQERNEIRAWYLLLTPGADSLSSKEQQALIGISVATILRKPTAPTDFKAPSSTGASSLPMPEISIGKDDNQSIHERKYEVLPQDRQSFPFHPDSFVPPSTPPKPVSFIDDLYPTPIRERKGSKPDDAKRDTTDSSQPTSSSTLTNSSTTSSTAITRPTTTTTTTLSGAPNIHHIEGDSSSSRSSASVTTDTSYALPSPSQSSSSTSSSSQSRRLSNDWMRLFPTTESTSTTQISSIETQCQTLINQLFSGNDTTQQVKHQHFSLLLTQAKHDPIQLQALLKDLEQQAKQAASTSTSTTLTS